MIVVSIRVPCCRTVLHMPRERLTVGNIYRWYCERHDLTWETEWTPDGHTVPRSYPGDVSEEAPT